MIADPITGRTALVGVMGWPVSHSVSPRMHNAAFAARGLDWRYLPLPVRVEPPARVGEAVRGLAALGFRGANVTVPHKSAVIQYLDRLAPAAAAIGAVNTIVVEEDGSLTGDNTDAAGFIADLRQHGVDPAGSRVLVLGAGGSARAVAYGLAQAQAAAVAILNRTPQRAAALVADLQPLVPAVRLDAHPHPAALAALAPSADLIVNCTSLGMTPHIESTPWDADIALRPGQVVYDLVYIPRRTQLLAQAEANGAAAIGGIGMLIWQGALAFERWTGQPAPLDVMRAAVGA